MYQITYSKSNAASYPLTTWADTAADAKRIAGQLRNAGYIVTVWEYGKNGARKTTI